MAASKNLIVGHDRVYVNTYRVLSASEIHMGSVWTIVGRSESEIFCSGSEIFHSGSEIFCSECEKKIVAILVCTHGDILVLLTDILGDILDEYFYNRRALFPRHFPTVI